MSPATPTPPIILNWRDPVTGAPVTARRQLPIVLGRESSCDVVLPGVPWWLFLLHYWSVWLATFIATQGPMRIIFPRWRYDGGQWL